MNRSQKIFVLLALVVFAAAILNVGCGSTAGSTAAKNTTAEAPIVDITTTQAVVKQIPTYFEATGNLASDASVDVAPAIAGKVTEVNFDIGSYVQKGSVLVRLDDRDARIRLEQARDQAG